jgi:hypothetical protein
MSCPSKATTDYNFFEIVSYKTCNGLVLLSLEIGNSGVTYKK